MKKNVKASSIIVFVILSLIPLANIILGISGLIGNVISSASHAVTFFLIPVVALIFLFLFSFVFNVENRGCAIFVLVILYLFVVNTFLFWGSNEAIKRYENEDAAENYVQVTEQFRLMPSLDETGNPESIELAIYSSKAAFFVWETKALICRYDETEYISQKELLENKYIFQNETISIRGHDCEPFTELDGYYFRTLSISSYDRSDIDNPKKLIFIATNDATHEIAYLALSDPDRDYIDSLSELIYEDCGWKHINSY